jgi:hypothetical protein
MLIVTLKKIESKSLFIHVFNWYKKHKIVGLALLSIFALAPVIVGIFEGNYVTTILNCLEIKNSIVTDLYFNMALFLSIIGNLIAFENIKGLTHFAKELQKNKFTTIVILTLSLAVILTYNLAGKFSEERYYRHIISAFLNDVYISIVITITLSLLVYIIIYASYMTKLKKGIRAPWYIDLCIEPFAVYFLGFLILPYQQENFLFFQVLYPFLIALRWVFLEKIDNEALSIKKREKYISFVRQGITFLNMGIYLFGIYLQTGVFYFFVVYMGALILYISYKMVENFAIEQDVRVMKKDIKFVCNSETKGEAYFEKIELYTKLQKNQNNGIVEMTGGEDNE